MPVSITIPQVGQPFSSQAVTVDNNFTNLSAWANGGIAGTDLSPTSGVMRLTNRTMSTNATANSGDLVLLSGAVTCTLPAPAANAVVGVFCAATGTPGTVSGTLIDGVGLSSASSFPVSSGACVLLTSDGSRWHIISGKQDSGWTNITLVNGWASGGGYTPATRLIGDQVFFRGSLNGNSATGSTVCTLAASFRPTSSVLLGTNVQIPLSTSGVITISPGPTVYGMDGQNYSIS